MPLRPITPKKTVRGEVLPVLYRHQLGRPRLYRTGPVRHARKIVGRKPYTQSTAQQPKSRRSHFQLDKRSLEKAGQTHNRTFGPYYHNNSKPRHRLRNRWKVLPYRQRGQTQRKTLYQKPGHSHFRFARRSVCHATQTGNRLLGHRRHVDVV